MKALIFALFLAIPIFTNAQSQTNDTLKKDLPESKGNLEMAALHLDRYKNQVNTAEGLKIGGAAVTGLTLALADNGSTGMFVGLVGGIGLSFSGFITGLTAESHLDNVSLNLKEAGKRDK